MNKTLSLATFLILSNAFAGTEVLKQGLKVIENPTNALNDPNCSTNGSEPFDMCKDLQKAICEVRKKPSINKDVDSWITEQTWKRLSAKPTRSQINATSSAAIKIAEDDIFKHGNINKSDVERIVKDSRQSLMNQIAYNKSIPPEKRTEIVSRVSRIKYLSAAEYIDYLMVYGRLQNSDLSEETLRSGALDIYSASCGANGMDVNAFYDKGAMVICPGLIYSLQSYSVKSKEEVLTALSFTIGHELSHTFDNSEEPSIYTEMKACYDKVAAEKRLWAGDQASEVTSDFWGAQVLGKRIKAQGLKNLDALKAIAMAVDGSCEDTSDGNHFGWKERVNDVIAKEPLIREALGCGVPTTENPYYSLKGMVTK